MTGGEWTAISNGAGLWRHELFARFTQAVLELAEGGSEERSILESIQNHLRTTDADPSRQHAFRLNVHST